MHPPDSFMTTRGICQLMLEVPGSFHWSRFRGAEPGRWGMLLTVQDPVWAWKLSSHTGVISMAKHGKGLPWVFLPLFLTSPPLTNQCAHICWGDKSYRFKAPNKNLKTHSPCMCPFKVKMFTKHVRDVPMDTTLWPGSPWVLNPFMKHMGAPSRWSVRPTSDNRGDRSSSWILRRAFA